MPYLNRNPNPLKKARKLFTESTEGTIKKQLRCDTYVPDPVQQIVAHHEVKAGPNNRHSISKWYSLRMGFQLEKVHHLMAYYGNTGMGALLADDLFFVG